MRTTSRTLGLIAAAAVATALFASAFEFAPRSCEGGQQLYFLCGIAALVALLIIPFATRMGRSPQLTYAWALGFVVAGIVVWLAGFEAANFHLACRLF